MNRLHSALLMVMVASNVTTAVHAQTNEQVAAVAKQLGRPQTKASALSFMAGFNQQRGKLDDALKCYDGMLRIYASDPGIGADSPKYAWALARKALVLQQIGKKPEAQVAAKEALTLITGLTPQNAPDDADYLKSVINDASSIVGQQPVLAVLRAKMRAPSPKFKPIAISEIPDLNMRIASVQKMVANKQSPDYMQNVLYLANLYALQKKYDLAEPKFKEVIAYAEKLHDPGALIVPLSNYGYMLKSANRAKEASVIQKRLEAICAQTRS